MTLSGWWFPQLVNTTVAVFIVMLEVKTLTRDHLGSQWLEVCKCASNQSKTCALFIVLVRSYNT